MAPMAHRTRWTGERIDDLAARMDAGFDRVERDIRHLGGQIDSLRQMMITFGGGMLLGFISILAAIIART